MGNECEQECTTLKKRVVLKKYWEWSELAWIAKNLFFTTLLTSFLLISSLWLAQEIATPLEISENLTLSFLIFCAVGNTFKMKIKGRVVVGGMNDAFSIAFGSFLIFLGGLIFQNGLAGLVEYSLAIKITSGIFALSGLSFIFTGFREG